MLLYLYLCIMDSQQHYIGKRIPTWLTSTEIMSYEQNPERAYGVVTTGNNVTAMQLFSDGQQGGHACRHSSAPRHVLSNHCCSCTAVKTDKYPAVFT